MNFSKSHVIFSLMKALCPSTNPIIPTSIEFNRSEQKNLSTAIEKTLGAGITTIKGHYWE